MFFAVFVIIQEYALASMEQQTIKQQLVDIAGDVVIEAVKFGLEEAGANKRYKSEIMGAVITSHASGTYTGDQGTLCRKIATDVPQWGLPEKHILTYTIYCRKEGKWEQVKILEQNEY